MERQAFRDLMLAFLREANPGVAIARVADDDDLIELGYVDSLRIMELIALFEDTLGTEIVLESMNPRAFRTVGGVYDAVILGDGAC